jgi:hypothetical protein
MMRIIYLCPTDNAPTGGVKVIYRHAAMLTALGADAYVLHPYDLKFRCTWFDADVRTLDTLLLDPKSDFVMIPELFIGRFAAQCASQGVKYGIFVQNGYMTMPILTEGETGPSIAAAYNQAEFVLVISDDTAEVVKLYYPSIDPKRIFRVRYSVDPRFLSIDAKSIAKTRTVTYMPRKLPEHCWRVIFALNQHLPPAWTTTAIQNVDEDTCAAMLRASRIFLAFSNFEGLPLPPIEAALAGNFVIGYTGQGAREYWKVPNFQEIQQGDIISFVKAASQAAHKIEAGKLALPSLLQAAARLAERFSPAAEAASLNGVLKRITACFA